MLGAWWDLPVLRRRTDMADSLVGNYEHVESENLEEYLTALDFPMMARKMIAHSGLEVQICKEDETWTISYKLAIGNKESFEVGSEYEVCGMEEPSKCLASAVDGRLEIREEGGRGTTIRTYEETEEGIKITLHSEDKDVTAVRLLKKVE